ncbi:MAG: (d)CMP kinase [Polyangiaceae bacterium]|nr:(d)CMP kinase [Polyangiaceae bacterium]
MVAIDGPAGAGKSTVTRRVAEELGYLLLGTGALYRAVALSARRAGLHWGDGVGVGAHAERLVESGELTVARGPTGEQRVFLGVEEVTALLGDQSVGQGASEVSTHPAVRAALLEVQRRVGAMGGIVAEGRDVGTVVFPDAEAKFFLTASLAVRAERRYRELLGQGIAGDLAAIQQEVEERDRRDRERAVAPLRRADDAMKIDSSTLSAEEVVALIVEHVRQIARELEAK